MKIILQSSDYKTLYLLDWHRREEANLEEFRMVYPYLVDLPYEGIYNKAEIWEDIKNAKKMLLTFIFDIDYIPETKKKLKENYDEIKEHLIHFKIMRGREILKELEKYGISPERITFRKGKTSFHLSIRPLKPLPLNTYTKDIVMHEYSQLFTIVQGVISKYSYYVLEPWIESKATYVDEINLDEPIDHNAIAYLFYKYFDDYGQKDVAKLERIIPQMVEVFQSGDHEGVAIFGGRHHSFIVLLAGELAISGFTLEEAIDIYDRYFAPFDNPRDYKERIAVIRHTYKRKENGEPIASWRMYRPEWRLTKPKEIINKINLKPEDFLTRGVKSYVFSHKEKMWELRLNTIKKNSKTGKKYYKITKRELKFPYIVEPIAFQDNKIKFVLYNDKEYYTILAPFPSTQANIKEFDNVISHLPLTKHQVRTLRMIVESFVAFRDLWESKVEIRNIYNEKEGLRELNTGLSDLRDLWMTNKLYRLSIALSLAKFQNPNLPNAVVWVWGETGAGKTRTLTKIAHAFGEEILLNATYNALETYASVVQNKPIVIEDLAVYRERLKDIFNLIFTAHSGIGKARRTNIAGSDVIYTKYISASFFLASEINPTVYLTLNSGEVGILRRVFILHLSEKIQFPNLTDGKGWAVMLSKIQPTSEDYASLEKYNIHEWHARAYLPYISAIYRVFNEMFGTNFDPIEEFSEMTHHLENVLEKTILNSFKKWLKDQMFISQKQRYIIYDPYEKTIVVPDMVLDLIAPLFNIDEEKLRYYLKLWGCQVCSIEIPSMKGLVVDGWDITHLFTITQKKDNKEVNDGEIPF